MKITAKLSSFCRLAASRLSAPSTLLKLRPDLAGIARQITGPTLKIKQGETVLILGREDDLFFCELIDRECRKLGARPIIIKQSDESAGQGQAGQAQEILALAAARQSEVVINLALQPADPAIYRSLPKETLAALGQARKALKEVIYNGEKRVFIMDIPTPAQAKLYGIDYNLLHNTFWRAINIDRAALNEQAARLADRLRTAEEVAITSLKGTSLRIKTGQRRLNIDNGEIAAADLRQGDYMSNLPCGEVCLAPLEDGTNGRAVFDLVFFKGQRIVDLELEFSNGRFTPIRAKEGFAAFAEHFSDPRSGNNCIAELGFGLNPAMIRPVGCMSLDEKILGSVHIGLGENRFLGGQNSGSLHLDLVMLSPTVTAANGLIINEGKLTV